MKYPFKLLSFLILFSFLGFSQDEGTFWYFGENAGLDFSTSPPSSISDGALNSFEGCSTISDGLGNLLMYTDGTTIWNRNHIPMPNGTGLSGNSSSAQSSTIIKDLNSPNLYYILSVGVSSGLYYSIVDMNLENGLGNVVNGRRNILIDQNTQEKVTFTINSAGDAYWIITFDEPEYKVYRAAGGIVFSSSLVTSNLPATSILADNRGMLKVSPDGTKLINTSVGDGAIMTTFDRSTGIVSNPIQLFGLGFNNFYGAEFSPDSNLVYLNGNSSLTGNNCGTSNQREIYQYQIGGSANWNTQPIALGGSIGANSGRGALQLAKDGKIYFARTCQPWLGVINNPTVIGTGANYVDDAVPLANSSLSREGLPNTYVFDYRDTYNTIIGSSVLDVDSNGCDVTDPAFSNLFYTLSSSNFNSYAISNQNGTYETLSPNGIFTLTPQPENPTYWNFSPANVVVDFPTQTSPFTQDFCVTANGTIEDLEVFVLPLEQARPGFDTDYKVVIKNKGNQTASGSVTLDFEEDFMTLLSTNPNAGNTPSNQLSWSFSNLQPFQMEEYEFTMTLNTPTQATNPLNGGDTLIFTGTVTGTGIDAMPADNTMVFDQTVVNSYDPNDKTCLEGETIEPSDVGEYVHYMIRFENTGTASAVNVVIKDEIDLTQFDITTLIPLGGSHDYYTRIREGNVVEFIHENINLDFNDATNDGHVLFKIKTLNTLTDGDTFDNTAEIYFDFNFPIVTNTETVTIMTTASIGETTDRSISVYPNPAKDFITVSSVNKLKSATLIDVNGRTLSQTNFTGNTTEQRISLDKLTSGVYFVTIQSDLGKKVEKVIVE
ncbi:putative repeat protein (TIGR01451 family)/predicted secreted protein (Por secretion system target) [Nonlabens dokdonensis]|uniref:Repeat protein (TIGR01451 family)/predicted secreted protein (Por secretion system target) n=2 Tax=Nonlabens dokdonensis TaxID=328515 RepID=A0ABX5PX62_9FLAO|nr:T9SS type A sorting domain-containing protein [Nonlabens dokdonensis]AGC77770.1 putative membrane-anchored cell surface protein [Nonlabens dokdonensis DSW-6]PZX39697.1 putative repeat protein (TIGR01451 family)/predicted secreted protein (Por secretion system target) [Nonlabens dokdonensis]